MILGIILKFYSPFCCTTLHILVEHLEGTCTYMYGAYQGPWVLGPGSPGPWSLGPQSPVPRSRVLGSTEYSIPSLVPCRMSHTVRLLTVRACTHKGFFIKLYCTSMLFLRLKRWESCPNQSKYRLYTTYMKGNMYFLWL